VLRAVVPLFLCLALALAQDAEAAGEGAQPVVVEDTTKLSALQEEVNTLKVRALRAPDHHRPLALMHNQNMLGSTPMTRPCRSKAPAETILDGKGSPRSRPKHHNTLSPSLHLRAHSTPEAALTPPPLPSGLALGGAVEAGRGGGSGDERREREGPAGRGAGAREGRAGRRRCRQGQGGAGERGGLLKIHADESGTSVQRSL
jgi:hypothetical protein